MNTSQLYTTSIKSRKSNPVMASLRKMTFFVVKPFLRTILENHSKSIEKLNRGSTKNNLSNNKKISGLNARLESMKSRIEHVSNDNKSQFKDFDAVLQRLSFIEKNLRDQSNETHLYKSELSDLRSILGPSSKLMLNGRASSVELPISKLTVHHGSYGDFILRDPDVVGDCIRKGEFWDRHLHDLIIRHSDMDGIAIDAGAYVGFHSCFLAKYFGKVISFEPQSVIFRMLAANLLLNNIENTEIHNVALYDHECLMRIASPERQEIPIVLQDGNVDYSQLPNAAALTFETSETNDHAVKALTLDSLALDNVRFIKIDTQGSDLKVLLGAKETIRRCRPVIVFEYEIELSKVHDSLIANYEEFFAEVGYEMQLLRSQENKQFDYLAMPV